MISKRLFSLFFVVGFLFVLSFVFMPDIGYAQAGCCINNGDNCSPGCGPQGTSCQIDEEGPQCATFVLGESCFQIENNEGVCQPFGCCELPDGTLIQQTEGSCEFPPPNGNGGTYLNDGPCMPPPPTGCCEEDGPICTDDVTQAECGGVFMVNTLCDGNVCGEAPPPVDGCCQREPTTCVDTTDTECLDSPFFPGGMCMGGEISFCNPPPTGCCVIEQGVCSITTEMECDDQDGDYQGDDTDCAGNPMCVVPSNVNVPTLNQWALIAVAGLLGVYSLMMVRRRNKYNIS